MEDSVQIYYITFANDIQQLTQNAAAFVDKKV